MTISSADLPNWGMTLTGIPRPLSTTLHGDVCADGDIDAGAEAGQGLVYGVVHHLIHQVVKATMPGGPDVHARSLANRLQTF